MPENLAQIARCRAALRRIVCHAKPQCDRVAADSRDLNYDKFVVSGQVRTMADEAYTSHNTHRLDTAATVEKILTAEYVQERLKEKEKTSD